MSFLSRLADVRNRKRVLWIVVLVAACAAGLVAAFNPVIDDDLLARYAPMAEAFGRGAWREAFHPRFGVLYPTLTGLLSGIGLDGIRACVLVACVAWALCAVPIHSIAARVFDHRVAAVAVALYLMCPVSLQYAFMGLREPLRMLGILLMVDGIVRLLDGPGLSWREFAGVAAGGVLLCLIKVDSVLFAGALSLVFAGLDRFRAKTWCLGAVLLVALQFPCYLVWSWTGKWVPSVQLLRVLEKIAS